MSLDTLLFPCLCLPALAWPGLATILPAVSQQVRVDSLATLLCSDVMVDSMYNANLVRSQSVVWPASHSVCPDMFRSVEARLRMRWRA